MRYLVFDKRVKKLIDAIGNADPHKSVSNLRVAIARTVHIEISEQLQFLVVHHRFHQLFKDSTVLHPVLWVDLLPHKLVVYALGAAFSEFA